MRDCSRGMGGSRSLCPFITQECIKISLNHVFFFLDSRPPEPDSHACIHTRVCIHVYVYICIYIYIYIYIFIYIYVCIRVYTRVISLLLPAFVLPPSAKGISWALTHTRKSVFVGGYGVTSTFSFLKSWNKNGFPQHNDLYITVALSGAFSFFLD